jgi:hypothetical protein
MIRIESSVSLDVVTLVLSGRIEVEDLSELKVMPMRFSGQPWPSCKWNRPDRGNGLCLTEVRVGKGLHRVHMPYRQTELSFGAHKASAGPLTE